MWTVALCMVALFAISAIYVTRRWRNPMDSRKLPPGSMGLPYLGETLQFFRPNCSSEIAHFIKHRMERNITEKMLAVRGNPGEYIKFQQCGPIFKTRLVGKPVVISTDADFNNYIFEEEDRQFQICYPDSFVEVFGKQNVGELHGFMFKYLKSLIMNVFGHENLKHHLLSEVDGAVSKSLLSWLPLSSIELNEATTAMISEVTARKLISCDSWATKKLTKHLVDVRDGLSSLPLDLPGTSYHRCLQGRKEVTKILKGMLEERLKHPREEQQDLLDVLIQEMNKEGAVLTKTVALDLLFVLLFSSFETSLAITFLMKLLTDHPDVLEGLTKEHDGILNKKEDKSLGISWEDYKSMVFTSQVINETLRLANITPVMYRKALDDVNIRGYTIPKGWTVLVCTLAVHMNPDLFPDPLSFNPSRWKGVDSSVGGRNFRPFGGGSRQCVGADFSKLQMSLFLHHLVTKYRWKAIKGGEIIRNPGLTFPQGFHIQLSERK